MSKKQIEKEIQNIINQLIKKYKPEKVILFGSAVWGKFGEDSDLDFLLIKKNTPYRGIDRMREVHGLINSDMPCDFLVAKPSEIKERLSLGDPFINEIIKKGKVLYG